MEENTLQVLEKWGISLTPEQTAQLELFREELLDKNARFNLISENDAGDIWPRHILDALAGAPLLAKLLKPGDRIADAGAGAGFPGIPLSVALPGFAFDLWDSNLKRQMFLNCAATRLKLKNVRALHSRIGQSPGLETGKYAAVVERAMGKLENILSQCLNMLEPGGVFLAWQSVQPKDSPEIRKTLELRRARMETAFSYRLPLEEKDRRIIIFRKDPNIPTGEPNAYP